MAVGRRGHRIDTAVIIPMVPSDPMNSCFRSNPVDESMLVYCFAFSFETPMGASKQMPTAVIELARRTSIILPQLTQSIPHSPVRKNDLQT